MTREHGTLHSYPAAQPHGDRPSGHVHKLIAETAQALAHESYAELMASANIVYEQWKAKHPGLSAKGLERAYVKRYWPAHIAIARATLARMLASPIDDTLGAAIMEALALDATLIRGRAKT